MTAAAGAPTPDSPRRIVLTGAAGFLGSHLAERFLDEGYEVVGVDNFITGSRDNIALLQERKGFHFQMHDVSTPLFLAGPVHGILHFASPASPVDYLEYPIQTLKVGSLGTHNMLGLAREKRARFLLASTSEVYGDPAVHPQPESYWGNVNPVGPRGVYDEAKRFAEAITSAYRTHHGLDTRIVRIFNTYGPRMRPGDGRVVSNFIVQALRGEALTLYGDGSQTRSFCYVSDLVEGIYRLFHSEHPGPMNLGNPNEFTVRELAEEVLRAVGPPGGEGSGTKPDPEGRSEGGEPAGTRSLPLPEDDPKVRQPDIALARGALGWEPSVSLPDGLARTIPWFRSQVEGFDARARPLT
ncbi:MAG: SDR family oxidoreductase [Gemmatimonadales bacterium]|nr:MAG: SDR family oxidoreductase [Gemmatimonadales bacterium]